MSRSYQAAPAIRPPTTRNVRVKDKEIYSKENSLSTLPKKLREYFEELRPAKKRESEWKCFEELRADYSAEDIADCLDVLVRHGIGKDGGERCHSPMAFLGKAMGEVLVEVGKYRVRAKERAVREEREAKELREKLAIEEREAEELAAKEKAFLMAFPTEDQKNEALARFCRGTPFAANTHAGRIIALGKWWESLGAHERENYVLLAADDVRPLKMENIMSKNGIKWKE